MNGPTDVDLLLLRMQGFTITATGDIGCDSGRPRYRVVCNVCGEVCHEGTTGPASRVRDHLAWAFAPRTISPHVYRPAN